MPTVECGWCGQKFYAKPNRLAKKVAAYCSRECGNAARKAKRPWVECHVCGKSFQKNRPEQKVCSPECGSIKAGEYAKSHCSNTNKRVHGNVKPDYGATGFGMSFDPWATGEIQPDEYGRGLYRQVDPVLGF